MAITVESNTDLKATAAAPPAPAATEEVKPAPAPEAAAETVELEPEDQAFSENVKKRIGKALYRVKQAEAAVKNAERARVEADEFARNEYRRAQEAERVRADLETRLKAMEGRETPPVEAAKEPVRADFESDAKYWEAVIDYRAEQKVKAAEERRAQADAEARAQARDQARVERNKAFAATVEDWDETVTALAAAVPEAPPGYLQEYILESELSAEVMYYFGKHPDEYRRIVQLSPIKAVAALGRLEAKLEKPAAAKPADAPAPIPAAAKSRAPDPITPIAASSQGEVPKDLSKMNAQETIEYWAARDKYNSRRRQRH